MSKIYCLMGKSCSGKDTIFRELMDDNSLNLKPIVLYTTRPKRENEIDGKEYFFIDESELNEYKEMDKIIEMREYDTIDGKWYYCTIDDGEIDLNKNDYLGIVTLEAYKSFRSNFGEDKIVPIYITLDDGIRLQRALKREMEQVTPNYNELCRRFIADNEDFSEEKLESSKIKERYCNYELQKCIDNIKKILPIAKNII
ncbi:guanylate kinase [Clostridium akagii]|uniref:guanylate kinase n=1 Tax=Clostridium akagii TaxID=91623 RepID=UPI00047B5C1F|nr:guanylate kinase [Clostridium akagii]